MSRGLFLLLLGACLGPRAAVASPCPSGGWVLADATLRERAAGSAEPVGRLPPGTRVHVGRCSDWWAEVEDRDGRRGWLPLSRLGSSAPPSAPGLAGAPPPSSPPAAALPSEARPSPRDVDAPDSHAPPSGDSALTPQRPLLLRAEPRWAAAVAGQAPAGRPVRELDRRGHWSLVAAGSLEPAWVVTAALHGPALRLRR